MKLRRLLGSVPMPSSAVRYHKKPMLCSQQESADEFRIGSFTPFRYHRHVERELPARAGVPGSYRSHRVSVVAPPLPRRFHRLRAPRQVRSGSISDRMPDAPGCPLCAISAASRCSDYSITSSARCCRNSGISRPCFLAVLRLMISSNFIGSCTGKSAGFAPLRMRST